ncbi:MAG: aminotransferase class V-fold PLP-dependent enzyme [Myxococcota bacterium]
MSEERPINLDAHATTPCDPRVVEAQHPYFTEEFGNPASRTHAYGWGAERAVERARGQIARLIGARSREVLFTSGATEANNLALFGIARANRDRGDHIIVCATEHRSVLDPARALEKEGFQVTRVGVDRSGRIRLDELREAAREGTLIISVMHANNEIGVLQTLEDVASVARSRGIPLHTDAAQSVGKVPVDVGRLGVDLLSLSGHKLYGPKGVGILYVRRQSPPLQIQPLLYGGGHERGLRSGTLAVPLCVGLGRACEIAQAELAEEAQRTRALRERLWGGLESELDAIRLNGHAEDRLPGNLNVSFVGVEASALLLALPDLALSSGSACTSGSPEPSHVLLALGLPPAEALSAIRIGIGRFTTRGEVDMAARRIVDEVRRLRAASPHWEDLRGRGRRAEAGP